MTDDRPHLRGLPEPERDPMPELEMVSFSHDGADYVVGLFKGQELTEELKAEVIAMMKKAQAEPEGNFTLPEGMSLEEGLRRADDEHFRSHIKPVE